MKKLINTDTFYWYSFDVSTQITQALGDDWFDNVVDFSRSNMKNKPIIPRSVTSREESRDEVIQTAVVDGKKIRDKFPNLYSLYKNEFKRLAEKCTGEKLSCAVNDLYGVNLNIQQGASMRYECHVDSNPVQGMLYITSHRKEEGGSLNVSNRPDVLGTNKVKKDCSIIEPKQGMLVFFDARRFSHFVEPLISNSMIRVAVAMNFYTSQCPESARPKDLNSHLGLE